MAKRPQWMDKFPTHVNHPCCVIKEVAAVIRQDAKEARKAGQREYAAACDKIAAKLANLANGGISWADAFGLDGSSN